MVAVLDLELNVMSNSLHVKCGRFDSGQFRKSDRMTYGEHDYVTTITAKNTKSHF